MAQLVLGQGSLISGTVMYGNDENDTDIRQRYCTIPPQIHWYSRRSFYSAVWLETQFNRNPLSALWIILMSSVDSFIFLFLFINSTCPIHRLHQTCCISNSLQPLLPAREFIAHWSLSLWNCTFVLHISQQFPLFLFIFSFPFCLNNEDKKEQKAPGVM